MERVSLFDATPKRYKLFSDVAEERERVRLFSDEQEATQSAKHRVVCMDCGHEMETDEECGTLYCPICGGTRLEYIDSKEFSAKPERVKLFSDDEAEEEEFQKTFSETTDPLELKLKEFSGRELTKGEFQKEFGEYLTEADLIEKGFGEVVDDNIQVSPDAFLLSRLFSSIKISITKSLELDPAIVNCENKKDVINNLGQESNFPLRVITMLKKAHGIPMQEEDDAWVEDSSICKDLSIEFAGQTRTREQFDELIKDRYPDAPENVLDLLEKKGVIEVEGDLIKFK